MSRHQTSSSTPILAFLALCLLALPAPLALAETPTPSGELVWLTDLDAALAAAEATDALIVVDLYAEWCGWCKKLEREVFPTPEFRRFAEGKVLLRVDVDDGAEGTALQARFDAFNLPTTLIIDSDQIRVGMVMGFAPAPSLVARFEAEIAGWQRIDERYPQILHSGSEALRRSLAQDLHQRGDGARAAALYGAVLEGGSGQQLDAPWLYYLQADALRLAGDFEAATRAAERARGLSRGGGLEEKLDLLAYQIAQDAGDCQRAKTTLQAFLERNPESKMRHQLARRLQALEQGRDSLCA